LPELVTTDLDRGVALVKINRPEVRNALNQAALHALHDALHRVGANSAVQCVVLAGEGGTFTTGDDLSETVGMDDSGLRTMIEGFQSLTVALREMPQPVIAGIEGYAVGGALEMAAACDLRVCDEATIFFCPEVSLGLLLSNGSSSILPRLIGAGRTRELMLTGRRFDAAWAERSGLVNRVMPRGQALAGAMEMAREVAAQQPAAGRASKRLLYGVEDAEVARALDVEVEATMAVFADPAVVSAMRERLARWAARKR
jgi:enoyl-CoA hydratase/carnithine racemase